LLISFFALEKLSGGIFNFDEWFLTVKNKDLTPVYPYPSSNFFFNERHIFEVALFNISMRTLISSSSNSPNELVISFAHDPGKELMLKVRFWQMIFTFS